MLRRRIILGLTLALLLAATASTTLAGSTWFNVILPRFGGTANTNVTTKSTSYQYWQYRDVAVGGGKTVRFTAMRDGTTRVGNWYDSAGGTFHAPYTSSQPVGAMINGKIRNKPFQTVRVQVWGTFDSY
jgi:hypothetical protein